MQLANTSINVGDWVNSDAPGIWQVTRVIEGVQKLRFKSEDRKRIERQRRVFCHRLVDESWKPAFRAEMCSGSFLQPLSDDDSNRVDRFLAENPEVLERFKAFVPESIDLAMDLRLDIQPPVSRESIEDTAKQVFVGIEDGLTNDEILQRIESGELARYVTELGGNAILRFLSKNHEVVDNEYVFRRVQLLAT